MLKKTIKFTDFNDQEREEEFYFHLSQAKIIRWNMLYIKTGGLKEHLEKIMREEDGGALFDFIEKMILDSYGKKTPNGGFLQNDDIRSEFESSSAYSKLLMEMIEDADMAASFLNAIIPKEMETELKKIMEKQETDRQSDLAKVGIQPEDLNDETKRQMERVDETGVEPEPVPRVLSRLELTEMDEHDLRDGLATGRYKLS